MCQNGLELEALKELIFDLIYRLLHIEILKGVCAMLCLVSQSCLTLCNLMDCSPPGSSVHGDSPGNNTGVHCHALFQGIFPTQGLNLGLPHCRQILYHPGHQGSPLVILLFLFCTTKTSTDFDLFFLVGISYWFSLGTL